MYNLQCNIDRTEQASRDGYSRGGGGLRSLGEDRQTNGRNKREEEKKLPHDNTLTAPLWDRENGKSARARVVVQKCCN